MAKAKGREKVRRRLSLSVRLSLLVLFAALLPLAAVVGINDYFARGTLIQQSRAALTPDANARAATVARYMWERMADTLALTNSQALPTLPAFIGCSLPEQPPELNCGMEMPLYQGSVERALSVGPSRDRNYGDWNLYFANGQMLISSNPHVAASSVKVPQEDLLAVAKQGKPWVSGVRYDQTSKRAYVYIYAPVFPTGQTQPILGFMRATLNLDYVWGVVGDEQNANGSGSYAFISDENGVRIADTHTDELFHSIQPVAASAASVIAAEHRFGSSSSAIPQLSLPNANSYQNVEVSLQDPNVLKSAELQNPDIEKILKGADVPWLHWSYYVLSPLSTVTSVADSQIRTSLISAAVIAVLAVLIGLIVGRGTTHPVRDSAAELAGAATALKKLASRQQSSAGEQQWVVDACKTGLDSVSYLSDAMNQAARRIIDASNWFSEYWDRLTEEQARRTVQHLLELARYIDEAARRQQASSERMGKAIAVTMQVSDQLVAGATAATQSADQLEQVVRDLRHVVGGSIPAPVEDDEFGEGEQMGLMPSPAMMPTPAQPPMRGIRSGRLQMPVSQPGQRQLAAPAGARAPQAPMGSWGSQRRPGESQVFNSGGGYGDYSGGYGDYGTGDQSPEQWSRMSGPASGPDGWGNR